MTVLLQPKKIQCTSKYAPLIGENSKKQSNIKDQLHKFAKKINNEEDWRTFRAKINLVNNLNKVNKNKYYNFQLNINNNTESNSSNEVRDKSM